MDFIENILKPFRICFSREASFRWFVIIIVGIMIRSDLLGTTSIIRDLTLSGKCYESMNLFFRSSSWCLSEIKQKWFEIVASSPLIYKEDSYTLLVADGVKQPKEGKFMPGVKKLYQESENSKKPTYMFGHMCGAVGVLAGTAEKLSCIPLHINLQDGIKTIASWQKDGKKEPSRAPSHVVQTIENGYEAAKVFGKSLLLLDRYYLSVKALETLNKCNLLGSTQMHLLTKAKKSCVAYEAPTKSSGRGRPAQKGRSIKLKELFELKADEFQETTLSLYGKQEQVRYYMVSLLWGQKLYQKMQFILVEYNGIQSILATTDLRLDPISAIRYYSFRYKIENMFKTLKQVVGGFRYQFWTKSMPRLNKYLKAGEAEPLSKVKNAKDKQRILQTLKATEGYLMFSCIALGVLQMIALTYSSKMNTKTFRYMRTPSKEIHSEATISCYLRKNIYRFMLKKPDSYITRYIKEKQEEPNNHQDSWAS